MAKYESQIKPWKEILKGKWVIFDTDAVISITSFSQLDILDEMKEVVNGFAIIHPIQLELMNTNNAKMRLERSKLLVDYDFIELPFGTKELNGAGRIQRSMPISSQASPTDLYLGATLLNHHNDRFIITANIKDFPMPVYPRVGHVLLQDDSKVKLLTLLSMDTSQLVS